MQAVSVFQGPNRRSCIRVAESDVAVKVLCIGAEGILFEEIPVDVFAAEWVASEFELRAAVSHYLTASKTLSRNDEGAIQKLRDILDESKSGSVPVDLFGGGDPATPVVEVAVGATIPLSPVSQPNEGSSVLDIAPETPPQTNPSSADPAIVLPPTESAVTPPVVPAQVAAPAPVAQAVQDDEEGSQAYAVHVNGSSVTVEMNKPREKRLALENFEQRPLSAVVKTAEPLFYVAFDENDVLVRVASMSTEDRKVVGALTGGWIAEGFTVARASLKDLAKHVSAARKVYEPKAQKNTGADPATNE